MSDRDERAWLRVFLVRAPEGDLRVAFAIDGRTYPSSEAVKRDVDEAYDELERQRIPFEYETRPIEPHEPPSDLPSWPDYRDRRSG
jgi:hypothetical protein